VASIPIYFNNLETSLKAAMIFPHEPKRAKAFAAWLTMQGVKHLQFDVLAFEKKAVREEFFEVACAATDFADIYDEAQKNREDGQRAGMVVAYLWGLICTDPKSASWNMAISATGEHIVKYASKNKRQMASAETLLKGCLGRFQPVLHLLGARTLRRSPGRQKPTHKFDRIFDPIWDLSTGYSRSTDLLFFAAEATLLQKELRFWDEHRGSKIARSEYLDERMFEFDDCWSPPPRQPGWPDTGRVKYGWVDTANMPKKGRAGRPKKNPGH
jgi:hypothetical protein